MNIVRSIQKLDVKVDALTGEVVKVEPDQDYEEGEENVKAVLSGLC